ncbi:MAG: hypothetical protein ACE5J5_00595 [Candidatus Hydrothermarchaeales archaeon]
MEEKILIFKVGKLWVFKHLFDIEMYDILSEYYNKQRHRFECNNVGTRNKVFKFLDKKGFVPKLVEDYKGYLVKVETRKRYASILRNSITKRRVVGGTVFLMSSPEAVDMALKEGAKHYNGEIKFLF